MVLAEAVQEVKLMPVYRETFVVNTRGDCDILDITDKVNAVVDNSGMEEGIALAFVAGSTGGITTIEYESGVVNDLKQAMDRIAPRDIHYDHDARWGDGNGHSHVRSALTGPGFAAPFASGRLELGTWQQIVLMDFDVRPRKRNIIVQVVGE